MEQHEVNRADAPEPSSDIGYPVTTEAVKQLIGRMLTLLESLGLSSPQLRAAKSLLNEQVYGWWDQRISNSETASIGSGWRPVTLLGHDRDRSFYRWVVEGDELRLLYQTRLTSQIVASLKQCQPYHGLPGGISVTEHTNVSPDGLTTSVLDSIWLALAATLLNAAPTSIDQFVQAAPPGQFAPKGDGIEFEVSFDDDDLAGQLTAAYRVLLRDGDGERFRREIRAIWPVDDELLPDLSNYRCFQVIMQPDGSEVFTAFEEPPDDFTGVTIGGLGQ